MCLARWATYVSKSGHFRSHHDGHKYYTISKKIALSEKSCLREETDLANVYIRPSHPKSTRDHRNVLFYAASHETFDSDKIVKCVYSSYNETFELRYIVDGRVDWNTAIQFSDATYARWKADVAGRRRSASVARPGNAITTDG